MSCGSGMSKSMSNWIAKSEYSSKVSNSSKSLSSKRIRKKAKGAAGKLPYQAKTSQFATWVVVDEGSSDGSGSQDSQAPDDEEEAASNHSQRREDKEAQAS